MKRELSTNIKKGGWWVMTIYSSVLTVNLVWRSLRENTARSAASTSTLGPHLAPSTNPNSTQLSDPAPGSNELENSNQEISPNSKVSYSLFEAIRQNPRKVWTSMIQGEIKNPTNKLWQYCAGVLVATEGISACQEVFTYVGTGSGAAKTAALLTLAANTPGEFVKFFNHQAPVMSAELMSQAAEQLARKEPETAVRWALSLPAEARGHDALAMSFESWFASKPSEASGWLNENRHLLRSDDLVTSVVLGSRGSDPEASLSWATQITDEAKRRRQIETTLIAFARKDGISAANWIDESKLPLDDKERLRALTDRNALVQHGGISVSRLGNRETVTFDND